MHNNNHHQIDTVIFDLGGVLIDWNPRYLYRKIFKTEDEITWFLDNICTGEWNDKQDGGRTFEEATHELLSRYPNHAAPIRAWYDRWQETIQGPLHDTVEILREVKETSGKRLYALTNWSAETFPWALDNFEFLHWFEGIVVSGVEKTRKPFPEFYQILFDRYNVDPTRAVFIDDNHKNIVGGNALGLHTIHFQTAADLRERLTAMHVLK